MQEQTTTRYINLPQGGNLEVQLSRKMIDIISTHFCVASQDITDDHVRMFMWGAVKNAVEKAENSGV